MPYIRATVWNVTSNTPIVGASVKVTNIEAFTDSEGMATVANFGPGQWAATVTPPPGFTPLIGTWLFTVESTDVSHLFNFEESGAIGGPTPGVGGTPSATYQGIDIYQDPATNLFYFALGGVTYSSFNYVADAEAKIDQLLAPAPTPAPAPVAPLGPTSAPASLGWLQGIADWLGGVMQWIVTQLSTPISGIGSAISLLYEKLGGKLDDQAIASNAINSSIKTVGSEVGKGVTDSIMGIANTLTKNIQDFGPSVSKEVSDSISSHSPDPEIKAAVDAMVKAVLSEQAEVINTLYHSPPDPAQALGTASVLASKLLAVSVSVGVAGALVDILHPIKGIGALSIAQEIVRELGTDQIIAEIMSSEAKYGIMPPLEKYFNSVYQPNSPDPGALTAMRTREFITMEDYLATIQYKGYSPEWADKMLNAAYGDPQLNLIRVLHELGEISDTDLDAHILRLGYRPEVRPLVKSYINKFQESRWRLRYITTLGMGYARGVMDKTELTSLAASTGLSAGAVDWITKSADIRKDILTRGIQRPKLVTVGELKTLYANDKITEDALRTDLQVRGYATDQVDILIEALNLSKSTEIEGKKKVVLSIAELLKAWIKEVITEDYLRIQLTLKGMTTEDQDILINTNRPKPKTEVTTP